MRMRIQAGLVHILARGHLRALIGVVHLPPTPPKAVSCTARGAARACAGGCRTQCARGAGAWLARHTPSAHKTCTCPWQPRPAGAFVRPPRPGPARSSEAGLSLRRRPNSKTATLMERRLKNTARHTRVPTGPRCRDPAQSNLKSRIRKQSNLAFDLPKTKICFILFKLE